MKLISPKVILLRRYLSILAATFISKGYESTKQEVSEKSETEKNQLKEIIKQLEKGGI